MSKTALITGVTGQDGSYLVDFLHSKNYQIHGVARRSSSPSPRLDLVRDKLKQLYFGDLGDGNSLEKILDVSQPDEIYNLGAMSHVQVSYQNPVYTGDVTGLGVTRFLEAIRGSTARFYQASSSEMFGSSPPPQNELTPFHPRSPYGCAKVFAYHSVVNYREAYGLHASNGILFNHESPRRGENFVTRKITKAIGAIKRGEQNTLWLGNLDARRDWGFAGDYVEAMWLMLQQPAPGDYVVATSKSFSVREFVSDAFHYAGLGSWENYVQIDPALYRPAEVDALEGDWSKASLRLGWYPKTDFKTLVRMMVDADL